MVSSHWLPLFFPFPVSMAGPHLCIQNDDRTCFLNDLIFYRHFLLISFLMAVPPRLPCVNKSGGRGGWQIERQQNREAKRDEGKGKRRRSLEKKRFVFFILAQCSWQSHRRPLVGDNKSPN